MIKTASRYLRKNKLITAINIVSLAVGISAMLVIFLLIQYDLSFDKHVQDGDRVYRIVDDGQYKNNGTLVPMVNTLKEEITGIESVVPIFMDHAKKIKIETGNAKANRLFTKEDKLLFTNSDYFNIYPHTWLSGSASVLNEPNKIVLGDKDLGRYFPEVSPKDVVGKTVIYADSILLQVAGVVADMDEHSDFKFNSFIAAPTIPQHADLKEIFAWDEWNNYNGMHQGLIKLAEGAQAKDIEKRINELVKRHATEDENSGEADIARLQPLSDVHFNTAFNYDATKPETLRNLILLALFLLGMGIINFVNLSTAQSIERAKEVGIRKTLGSSKARLSLQFLVETFIVTFGATLLSILLIPILLHAFEGFVPEGLTLNDMLTAPIALFLAGQLLIVTLLAGFYPAWVLTGYAPALALKNQLSKNSNLTRSTWLRKALTVTQFVLAHVFLICTIIVMKQISYVSHKDLGFRKDAIINFYIPGAFQNADKGNLLKTKLQQVPEIKSVSFGNQSPAFSGTMTSGTTFETPKGKEKIQINSRNGDEQFLDVYQIPLVAGRNIRLLDTLSEALINEKALSLLHCKTADDAIGKTLGDGQYTIVGVMKDFDLASARSDIQPLMYWGSKNGYVMHVALDQQHPENWKTAIDKMTTAYKTVFPEDEFSYKFLDETIAGFYRKEQQLAKLLNWAVSLSVLIAGLGLFGLAIFTANQRTKEIGIRKVLGASVAQLLFLLLKNLLALVAVACLIAFPIAWFFMNKWLEDFVYRTNINWWIFVVSALGLMGVATLVLLSRTFFAARANPVDSLRDE